MRFAIDSSSGTHLKGDVRIMLDREERIISQDFKHQTHSQPEATGHQLYISIKLAAWVCIELIMRASYRVTFFLFPPCNHHLHLNVRNQ